MKLIDSNAFFFGEVPTEYYPALKFIEEAGRVCYKSEDKITDKSAEPFVKKLINAGHLAMLEHSNFVIRREGYNWFQGCNECVYKLFNKYFKVVQLNGYSYISGNLTAWAQLPFDTNALIPFLRIYGELFNLNQDFADFTDWEICPHEEIPKKAHRYSAKFICDRGVSHELVRHRPTHMWQKFLEYSTEEFKSFAQESTRYVNYANKGMEFIKPSNWENWSTAQKNVFKNHCLQTEIAYEFFIKSGFSPQRARAVLPNVIKTEVVVTTDLQEWKHFFHLRCHKSAHPDMVRVATMLRDKFQEKGLISV